MASEGGGVRNRKPLEQPPYVEAADDTLPADHASKDKKTIGRTPDGTGISPWDGDQRPAQRLIRMRSLHCTSDS